MQGPSSGKDGACYVATVERCAWLNLLMQLFTQGSSKIRVFETYIFDSVTPLPPLVALTQ